MRHFYDTQTGRVLMVLESTDDDRMFLVTKTPSGLATRLHIEGEITEEEITDYVASGRLVAVVSASEHNETRPASEVSNEYRPAATASPEPRPAASTGVNKGRVAHEQR